MSLEMYLTWLFIWFMTVAVIILTVVAIHLIRDTFF